MNELYVITIESENFEIGSPIYRVVLIDFAGTLKYDGIISNELVSLLETKKELIAYNGLWTLDMLRGAGINVDSIVSLIEPYAKHYQKKHNLSNDTFQKLKVAAMEVGYGYDESDIVSRSRAALAVYKHFMNDSDFMFFASIAQSERGIKQANIQIATARAEYEQAKAEGLNNWSIAATTSDKNWMITLLLAVFVGWLGTHRFYVGKTGTGVLMLLTAGCMGVLWIVDIIMIILGKYTDKDGKIIGR